jgi:hypothetical protein
MWREIFLSQVNFQTNYDMDIYEFGVYSGDSVKVFIDKIPNHHFNNIWGFDSFEGMPFCEAEPVWQESWSKGGIDARILTHTKSPEEASKKVEERISNDKYKPIIGFFDKVLTDDIVEKLGMKPALIIDIDSDLYSSACTVLDFMFRNKLYKKGTLLFYDDWGGSKGFETFSSGESRAHKELTAKYGIQTREIFSIGTEFPHVHKVFTII